GELDEGKVLARARLLVARQPQPGDFTKLREVLLHLVLVETVGDASHVHDAGLAVAALCRLLGDLGYLADVLAGLELRHRLVYALLLIAAVELLGEPLDSDVVGLLLLLLVVRIRCALARVGDWLFDYGGLGLLGLLLLRRLRGGGGGLDGGLGLLRLG